MHLWARAGVLLSGLAVTSLTGAAVDVPIVDTHVHYNADARATWAPGAVMDMLDRAGVSLAFVSSTPDDGTLALFRADPARVVPILRPYRTPGDRSGWWENSVLLDYVLDRLTTDVYRGVGEFHLWSVEQVQSETIKRLVDEVVKRGLLIHVHAGVDPIHGLFALNPELRILWAHAGMDATPVVIGELLDRYPRLWTELSLRTADLAPAGRLADDWRTLLLRHAERFMIGSDTWAASRWPEYESILDAHRAWLTQLPSDVMRKIAHQNARSLIGAPD